MFDVISCQHAGEESMCYLLGGLTKDAFRYEDVELCWRAWVRGWKTTFVLRLFVGIGRCIQHSMEGARMGFRGILCGRLLTATSFFDHYVIGTCLVSLAGLVDGSRTFTSAKDPRPAHRISAIMLDISCH